MDVPNSPPGGPNGHALSQGGNRRGARIPKYLGYGRPAAEIRRTGKGEPGLTRAADIPAMRERTIRSSLAPHDSAARDRLVPSHVGLAFRSER